MLQRLELHGDDRVSYALMRDHAPVQSRPPYRIGDVVFMAWSPPRGRHREFHLLKGWTAWSLPSTAPLENHDSAQDLPLAPAHIAEDPFHRIYGALDALIMAHKFCQQARAAPMTPQAEIQKEIRLTNTLRKQRYFSSASHLKIYLAQC